MAEDKIPASATHVVVPVDLFRELVTEAEVGYHGFVWDTDLWSRVTFTTEEADRG